MSGLTPRESCSMNTVTVWHEVHFKNLLRLRQTRASEKSCLSRAMVRRIGDSDRDGSRPGPDSHVIQSTQCCESRALRPTKDRMSLDVAQAPLVYGWSVPYAIGAGECAG